MTWEQTLAKFQREVGARYKAVLAEYGEQIVEAPERFESFLRGVLASLNRTKALLRRLRAGLATPPRSQAEAAATARYAEMKGLYDAIVLGFQATVGEDQDIDYSSLELGFIPAAVVLVIAIGGATMVSLAFTVAGVCWALVAYEYVMSLELQAAIQNRELDARVEAMRTGKVLQESTAPPPPPPPPAPGKGSAAVWLIGLTAATGAAIFVLPRISKAWG